MLHCFRSIRASTAPAASHAAVPMARPQGLSAATCGQRRQRRVMRPLNPIPLLNCPTHLSWHLADKPLTITRLQLVSTGQCEKGQKKSQAIREGGQA